MKGWFLSAREELTYESVTLLLLLFEIKAPRHATSFPILHDLLYCRRTTPRSDLPRPRTAPNLISAAETVSQNSHRLKRRCSHSETALVNKPLPKPQPSSADRPDRRTESPRDPTPHRQSHWSSSRENTSSVSPRQGQQKSRMLGVDDENASILLRPSLTPATTCPRLAQQFQSRTAEEDDHSTQSISPSRLWPCYQLATTDHDQSRNSWISIIDLTTSQRHASGSYPTPTSTPEAEARVQAAAPVSSPSENTFPHEAATRSIQPRPNEVRPKRILFLQESLPRFTTHVTPLLAKVTAGAGLNEFRPAFIARDVRVSERGHWQFFVRLAERSETVGSRQHSQPCLKLLGSTTRGKRSDGTISEDLPSINPSNFAMWTEDELVLMWDNVTTFIERGKVGLDTWMVKESADGILWRIRIFTWGEIVAHVWFLLYTFSNKLTGEMPMEWIAGDGTVVVQMSPGRNLDGLWQPGRREGEAGVWTFKAAL